eukprot:gnl/TRDRNA2_/TRDRNA2_184978_c0_seq1.p1 gnl/TRDRNA2_/TRDRNA2_184978_c0~~gnl/TRDRNA2_/TRDRNA2_184978_c0_seq1.p1  ORF type:complete len:219 (-),score=35.73 gnl/TRDRNA2_/TRDRNA2_184978_c0_seq1:41-697(-)
MSESATSAAGTLPTPSPGTTRQVLACTASVPVFLALLVTRPKLEKSLLDVRSADGVADRFEKWTVLKVHLFALLQVIAFAYRFIFLDWFKAPFVLLLVVAELAVIQLAWFTVVKQPPAGLCGRHGYILWLIWLLLEPFFLKFWLSPSYGPWPQPVMLLLYVPNFFMAVACARLFAAPAVQARETTGQQLRNAARDAAATMNAAAQASTLAAGLRSESA